MEAREKEVQQLTRALEKTDEHISSLENELQMYRSSVAPSRHNEQCLSSEHDAASTAIDTTLTLSLDGICHQPSGNMCSDDGTHSDNSSCRKKLKFTTDSCN